MVSNTVLDSVQKNSPSGEMISPRGSKWILPQLQNSGTAVVFFSSKQSPHSTAPRGCEGHRLAMGKSLLDMSPPHPFEGITAACSLCFFVPKCMAKIAFVPKL